MGCLPSLFRIFLETNLDHVLECRRSHGLQPSHRRWLPLQNGGNETGLVFSLECLAAGCHFVENRAQSKNVGADVGLFPFDLFGRHVLERSENGARSRKTLLLGWKRGKPELRFRRFKFGEPKIEQLGARFREHDVARLQVAVGPDPRTGRAGWKTDARVFGEGLRRS